MKHFIDLLSILTPKHLRQGLENRTRFDCGDFEINIFETFQSSTKVLIQYDGLSISSMLRGHKIVNSHNSTNFIFESGTTLILPEGETIYADFPEANNNNPVQCATILIPSEKLKSQLKSLALLYPDRDWTLDYSNFHFNNNSELARAFNELLLLTKEPNRNLILNDLLLKSFLLRIIYAQQEHSAEMNFLQLNHQLFKVKQYIKEHISEPIPMDKLTEIGNCSKRTLFRFFETYCHRTPGEYILHERMALARNLLLRPDNNISSVAFTAGFTSLSYFAKQFKLHNNCTPREFIKKFRA
ncbi:helix-turn-helix domain-containing protein [Sphingobacterium bovistauri]|uniref:Helix-turn-helix transcriptional regulator n=1 Tax=Sphingobacterium bovistauri TaxID=2781959 RepID=A0ABS7Z2B4_9SPHI|nr:AraC family transcriptional regulator [Sphingobacterium bovistauri]MCA5003737.1 helix-turn-helix transcriptional regulator [Sphingobacterium bovistauri]